MDLQAKKEQMDALVGQLQQIREMQLGKGTVKDYLLSSSMSLNYHQIRLHNCQQVVTVHGLSKSPTIQTCNNI